MDNLLTPQFLGPALVALITAAGSYFIIIQKTRNELADQTKRALDAFREKTEVAEANNGWPLERSKERRCRTYVKKSSNARPTRAT